MPLLDAFSDAELAAEVERRRQLMLAAQTMAPQPLTVPQFITLRSMIIEGVERAARERYFDEDFPHYVYEAAMVAVYGAHYWDWHRKLSK